MITGDGVAKIVDFGLAKLAGQTVLTKTGTTVGTAAYMSPEQARAVKTDHRTDIWSLGVVLYEMLTRQRPFNAEYEQALIYLIINEDPEPMEKLLPDIPVELIQIVKRALEKNPDNRYSSAAEIINDLKKYQGYLQAAEQGTLNLRALLGTIKRPRILIPAVGVLTLSSFWLSGSLSIKPKYTGPER